jgi:hypothetical protein
LRDVGAWTDRDHTLTHADATHITRPARIVLAGRVSAGSSFRPGRRHLGAPEPAGLLIDAVRPLWAKPRVPAPPPWTWRDRMLVLALSTGALLEALVRDEAVWRTSAVRSGVELQLLAPWRRTIAGVKALRDPCAGTRRSAGSLAVASHPRRWLAILPHRRSAAGPQARCPAHRS